MHLTRTPTHLSIHLDPHERFWALHLGATLEIPLAHIAQVSTTLPIGTWREVRAPGTFVPGMIKAGTYYTERGREFWYVVPSQTVLCMDIREDYYKRIVLSLPDSEAWCRDITTTLADIPGSTTSD